MIHGARPVYPKEAKTAHIEGVVKVDSSSPRPGQVAGKEMALRSFAGGRVGAD